MHFLSCEIANSIAYYFLLMKNSLDTQVVLYSYTIIFTRYGQYVFSKNFVYIIELMDYYLKTFL